MNLSLSRKDNKIIQPFFSVRNKNHNTLNVLTRIFERDLKVEILFPATWMYYITHPKSRQSETICSYSYSTNNSCNDSRHIASSWALEPTQFMIFIQGLSTFYFHSLIKLTFLVSKGLLYLYVQQNNTWLIVDMAFLFSWSDQHWTKN